MKAHALTLHWHTDNQPIYSAHFQPTRSGNGRLATAGGDNNVRMWRVELTDTGPFPTVTYLSTLTKHTQAVNVVRFDYNGEILASAGDDGNVILWALASDSEDRRRSFGEDPEESANDRETWRIKHLCRSSMAEIYDLAWSPDSQYLIAGSMDNVARIYLASTGLCVRQIAEHSHYVQGVAWDPLNEYVATQSSDRSVHIYTLKTKDGQFVLNTHHKISRAEVPNMKHAIDVEPAAAHSPASSTASSLAPPPPPPAITTAATSSSQTLESPTASTPGTPSSISLPMNPPPLSTHSRRSSFGNSPQVRRSPSPSPALPLPAVRQLDSPKLSYRMAQLYHNEGLTSFFRRLTFTPDGSLLLTPAGQFKYSTPSGTEEMTNTVYIYTRAGLNRPPVAHLPSLKKPAIVVKCSPVKHKLREVQVATRHITIDTSAADGLSIPALSESQDPPASLQTPPTSIPSTTPAGSTGRRQAFALPYRVIYAIATQDSVFIYDTQQTSPLCVVSNLHYATFTDLTWSVDGRVLFMTSTDGFCSVVVFEKGELGAPYEDESRLDVGSYLPTPAAEDGREEQSVEDEQKLRPIISPVPAIASSNETVPSQGSTTAVKREAWTEIDGEKKKKRVAPILLNTTAKLTTVASRRRIHQAPVQPRQLHQHQYQQLSPSVVVRGMVGRVFVLIRRLLRSRIFIVFGFAICLILLLGNRSGATLSNTAEFLSSAATAWTTPHEDKFHADLPDSLISDIRVKVCPLVTKPFSARWCEIRSYRRVDKDLGLRRSWLSRAYVFVKDVAKQDIESDDSVVVLDVHIGQESPEPAVVDVTKERNNKHVKIEDTADQVDGEVEKAVHRDRKRDSDGGDEGTEELQVDNKGKWVRRSHNLWLKLGKPTDFAVSDLEVLYGIDAVDPRFGWSLKGDRNTSLAVGGNAHPRITIRLGGKQHLPAVKLRLNNENKFKIVQVADLHLSTGVGKCMDPWPPETAEGCEADPRTLAFVQRLLDEERPDFAVLTGDQIFGDAAPDAQTAFLKSVAPFIQRAIPFAITFGNHDDESDLSRAQLMMIASHLPYSLSQSGPEFAKGVGNYHLNVLAKDRDHAAMSLYFLDTHKYSPNPKQLPGYNWLDESQLEFLVASYEQLTPLRQQYTSHYTGSDDTSEGNGKKHLSMAFFHIPLTEYRNTSNSLVGEYREPSTAPKYNTGARSVLEEIGVSVVSVGHDHVNDFCMIDRTYIKSGLSDKDKPLQTAELEGRRLGRRNDGSDVEHAIWLCHAGAAGLGGYGGYGGFIRRLRFFEIDADKHTISTWKRVEYGTDEELNARLDYQVLVESGKVNA
ncbi:hypothetical protein POJ06DRAFT_204280 [Lipomyces tetrasporus]|uniref:Calcineurin-like phosphoesterase domain-containing protein n=1 Tax=Lipomyces tetrasporus TaxID=54092 RepID=A0AAD7QYJ8_9ASCO|nr:uncharacterized protein POJ06DRAFT_204280 [Lipomyces tetrasporus]KAJ8103563.1 hypothetical protein POJ06DRAFT_204280 [Lipomyces tetrasporus]